MPRSGANIYSKPAGTTPSDGDTVSSTPFNLLMNDIAADLNLPRPIVAGGTGASSAAAALTNLGGGTAGKAIFAATTVANAQTTIGLVPQVDSLDTTAGSVLTVGAFGLGLTGTAPPIANVNATDRPSGTQRFTTGATGTLPVGITADIGGKSTLMRITSTAAWELMNPNLSNNLFFRRLATTWEAWQQIISVTDSTVADGDMLARIGGEWKRLPKGLVGQVLRQNDALTQPVWSDPVQTSAVLATTSGTSFDFTGIPAWVSRIVVNFANVSLSGTDHILVQLGTAGSFATTAYNSASIKVDGAGGTTAYSTSGFVVYAGDAASFKSGHMSLTRTASGGWVSSHSTFGDVTASSTSSSGGGRISLTDITRLRITRTGTNTFDNGGVSITWE